MRERIRAYQRRFALLIAALAVSAPTHGAPPVGAGTKKRGDQEVSWLSPSDLELLQRSYLRCLRAQYARMGGDQPEAVLVAAFNQDLDQFTLLMSSEDVKRAPKVLVSRVAHIGCEWFNDGTATAR